MFVLHVGEVLSRERKRFGVLLCEEQSHVHYGRTCDCISQREIYMHYSQAEEVWDAAVRQIDMLEPTTAYSSILRQQRPFPWTSQLSDKKSSRRTAAIIDVNHP